MGIPQTHCLRRLAPQQSAYHVDERTDESFRETNTHGWIYRAPPTMTMRGNRVVACAMQSITKKQKDQNLWGARTHYSYILMYLIARRGRD